MSQPSVLDLFTPVATTGEGNCLFRAVSLALFGTENRHDYLRLATAIEMTLHIQHYDKTSDRFLKARFHR
jgi:hypothetical protein